MANEFELVDIKLPDNSVSTVKVPKGTSDADATQIAMQDFLSRNKGQESVLNLDRPSNFGGVAKQGIIKGVAGLGDLVMGAPQSYSNLIKTMKGEPNTGLAQPITSKLIKSGVITPANEPVGMGENMVGFGSQMLPSLINPQNTLQGFKQGLLQGSSNFGSQLARGGAQATTGALANEALNTMGVDNPLVKAVGVGAATAIPGAYGSMRGNIPSLINKDIKNISPELMQKADDLVKYSISIGSPITAAEAISSVTQGGSRLPALQRFIENQPKGDSALTMANFLRNREAGATPAMNTALNQISPYGRGTDVPINLQKNAQGFLEKTDKGITGGVEPLYTQAKQTPISIVDKAFGQVYADPKIKEAINIVTSTPKYGVKDLSRNDFRTLQAAKDYLDDTYSKQMNALTGAEKKASAITYGARQKLDDFLASKSPEYAQGRDIYAKAQESTIVPRKEGLVGQIANAPAEMGAQGNLLMAKQPIANAKEIETFVKLLRRENPVAVPAWTRNNLNLLFQKSMQENRSGLPEFGAADFASKIMGNPAQRENIKALITTTASPQAYQGFENLINVFKAQGERLPANSATAFNRMTEETMGQGGPIVGTAKIISSPSRIGKIVEDIQMSGNSQKLADLLTSPDGVRNLEQLAKLNPKSKQAEAIVNSLAAGYIASKPPIEENK